MGRHHRSLSDGNDIYLEKFVMFNKILVLWILALILLGVVSYYAQRDIDKQRLEARDASVPRSVR